MEDILVFKLSYKFPFSASKNKDTDKNEVNRVTFVPKLKSFEQDIMDQMGIKEDRQYRKTFWY